MSTGAAAASPTRSSPTTSSAQAFFKWDPAKSEYPNLVLIALWDQRSQDNSASDEYGRFIVPKGTDNSHVIKGKTWDDLITGIRRRFKKSPADVGDMRLADDFAKNLKATVARFNGFARKGEDLDFHRGERQVELLFNGPTAPKTGKNPTMYPISSGGPLLRDAPDRRQSRHQGRPGDQRQRPGSERDRRADTRPLRRRQLRRLGLGARLLGGRRHARPVHGLRLSRSQRREPGGRAIA